MTLNTELLAAARKYHGLGYSIIPLKGNQKITHIKWGKYQKEKPDINEIEEWFQDPQVTGIGLITGEPFDLLVLDVEKEGLANLEELEIPETVCSESGGGGKHYFFKWPKGIKSITTKAGFREKMDVRGKGGYIVMPPSFHPSGNKYKWINEIGSTELSNAPKWLIDDLKNESKTRKKSLSLSDEVPEGKRNSMAARWAGKFISECHNNEVLYEIRAWTNLQTWNQKNCQPPLDEKELRKTFDSIVKKHDEQLGQEKEVNSKVKRLVDLVLGECKLFHDQFDAAYVQTEVKGVKKVIPCDSNEFKRYLGYEFWEREKNALNDSQLKTVINTITAKALYESEQIELFNRVGHINGSYYYDLTNEKSEVVEINVLGWQLLGDPPILFKPHTHQDKQVTPDGKDGKNGDINKILNYINIKSPDHQLLLLVYLVFCFIPEVPRPIAIIYGPQGSAKSTTSKFIKRIVDPSKLEVSIIPSNEEQLIQLLSHHWLIFFDNITSLRPEISNILCMASTGGGMSKRVLYSNDDDMIYNFKRCIGLNGINLVTKKPDLLDRSIIFELERIKEESRVSDKALWDSFKQDLPIILGGIFDVLSKAMAIHPTITLSNKPRMADFAEWGCAIAKAMGYKQEDFEQAYNSNRMDQNEAIIENDVVATKIVDFMRGQMEWSGTATELFKILTNNGTDKIPNFPNAPNKLSSSMTTIQANLEACGIKFKRIKDSDGKTGRQIMIQNTSEQLSLLSYENNLEERVESIDDPNLKLPPNDKAEVQDSKDSKK